MKLNLFGMAQALLDVADNVNNTYEIQQDPENGLSRFASQESSMNGNQKALSLTRAILNGDYFDALKLSFDEIINLVSQDPLSYENYLEAISQYCDAKIIQFSQDEQLRFAGGECCLTVDEANKRVHTQVDLYFKNTSNGWIKKIIEGNTSLNNFTAETLDGEITDILEAGFRKFPITPPESE